MDLTEVFQDLQNKDTEFYIWGVYWRGEEVYKEYCQNINIVGFIDGDPGKEEEILANKPTFSNLPIFTPKILDGKNIKTTKVIMAYHSSYILKDTLENYGFSKNISWFEHKSFDVLYNYSKNEKVQLNHVFFSLKDDHNISNRFPENNNFLPFEKICQEVDTYFNSIDKVKFFGILDEDWTNYSEFKKFLDYLYSKNYFRKVENFFIFANSDTDISDDYLELFSKYGVVLRLSNYKKIGCNTEPLIPLISRLDKFKVEYYLMFATQEGKRKYVPGEKVLPYKLYSFSINNYDYPNGEVKNATLQHFFSTCDGDIRTVLKNNKLYFQKTLDLCTYLEEIDFEELDNFNLDYEIQNIDLIEFLIGEKNKQRPSRDLKLCFTGHGLGNQLFHYTFKRYIEEHIGETLLFEDTKFLCQPEHNGSELRNILPNAKIQFLSDYFPELIFKQIALIDKRAGYFLGLLQKQKEDLQVLSEQRVFIDLSIGSKDIVYSRYRYYPEMLDEYYHFIYYGGYWFHEDWLMQQKSLDKILNEFEFTPITDEQHLQYEEQIKSTESVAVHVRRGDALNEQNFLVESDYFQESVQKYKEYIHENYNVEPAFFVFSDDLEWCKENVAEIGFKENDKITFVETYEAFRDIQFMSLCQHMIVCRSTFSFFASLLNRNKTYIKPFSTYDVMKDTIDLEMLPNGIYK